MDPVRRAAQTSVARAVGFAGLAMVCLLVGLSWNPPLAARTGGVLCLAAAFTLTWKGHSAPTRDHRDTETWLLLEEGERPPAAIAQKVTGTVLQEIYFTFAMRTAAASVLLLTLAFVLALAMPASMTALR